MIEIPFSGLPFGSGASLVSPSTILETWLEDGGPFLRRLYSTFARGWPGAGLLLMRIVAATALVNQAVLTLQVDVPIKQATWAILAVGTAVLLLLGLWTPVVGAFLALLETWNVCSHALDPWVAILLGTLGLALALLGPGAWSCDARFFGWKRIDLRSRQS